MQRDNRENRFFAIIFCVNTKILRLATLRLFTVFCFVLDCGYLFYLLAIMYTFQSKDHISCSLEVSDIPHPAYAAITMLQAYKLLFHFTTTAWTDFIANTHTRFSLESLTPIFFIKDGKKPHYINCYA